MKWNRWLVGLAAIAMVTMAAAGAFAQTATAEAAARAALTAEQQELAAITADRSRVIREVVDQWRSQLKPANPAMNEDGGEAELTVALSSASPEMLLAASRAQSYEELMALLPSRKGPSVILLGPGPIPSTFGSATGDLVFNPITPCRIIDTRLATGGLAGRLVAGSGKQFLVNMANYTSQGGSAAGCGIPASLRPGGVAINLTSADQTGVGNLRVVQSGGGVPTASLLNYTPGVNLANAAVVSSSPTSGLGDIFILSNNSDTHAIVDIMGYFAPPVATALSCTTVTSVSGAIPSGASSFITATCPAGYTVTGGGLFVGSAFTPAVYTFGSSPSGNGWESGIYNTQPGTITNTAYAICCRVPGR
jgi:hypothetical protein